MTLHLGHVLGLNLIKEALSAAKTQPETWENTPLSEGSDNGSRAISEMFDSLPSRNAMTPETIKSGAEAAFTARSNLVEDRNEMVDHRDRAPDGDDSRNISVERAWREHSSFEDRDDGSLPEIATPGPAF